MYRNHRNRVDFADPPKIDDQRDGLIGRLKVPTAATQPLKLMTHGQAWAPKKLAFNVAKTRIQLANFGAEPPGHSIAE
jgi:hypothetical protein